MKTTKDKILAFAIVCAYLLAVLGGVGYLCYLRTGLIAAAVVALGAMAWPVFSAAWKTLWNE